MDGWTIGGLARTTRLFPCLGHGPIVSLMETRTTPSQPVPEADSASTPAEELPGLYRTILERVAELELRGDRLEASRIRMAATETYSGSWDESGRSRLIHLVHRADRVLGGHDQPRGFALRRRSASAR